MTVGVSGFAGLRVLVLEDEALVSIFLEEMLEELGCEVVGSFQQLQRALDFAGDRRNAIDAAILDVNVAGSRSFPVAEVLADRGIPFAFSTGYDEGAIEERWRDRPNLRKPFLQPDLERILAGMRRGGTAGPPA